MVLDNGAVRVVVDGRGLLTSIYDVVAERELLAPDAPANLLQLFRDTPTQWDAWDVDARYRRIGRDLVETVALDRRAGSGGARRPLDRPVDDHAEGVAAGERPRRRHPHRGRLARAPEAAQAGVPARRARGPGHLGDPVRACPPPDAREHVLGRSAVRDLRTPMGARRRARLRGGRGQRRDLRPRHHPHDPPWRGDHHDGPAVAAACAAVPRPGRGPGWPPLRRGAACRRDDRRRDRRGLPAQPAAAADPRRTGRSRR